MTTGVVVTFDQRNGFGFIRSRAFREDVFVHACAVAGGKLLRPGQRVTFEAQPSDNGPRAVRVQPRRVPFKVIARVTPEALVALGAVVSAAALLSVGRFALGWAWPLAWLASLNLVTLGAFVLDKRRAIIGARRISETLLLTLALAGGSPAIVLAMPVLRHKTHKGAFRLAMTIVVVLQLTAVAAWYMAGRPGVWSF